MKIYVIKVWDGGQQHVEGTAFKYEGDAKRYVENDEWLEYEEVNFIESA